MSETEWSLIFRRGIRRGLLTLRRQRGWGTSIGVLLGILLLVQLLVVFAFGVQGMDHLIRAQTDLRLQIQENASDRQIQEFLIAVHNHATVLKSTYVTREQAYENERGQNPQLIQFLEEFRVGNPFPDTVAITLKSLNDYDTFAEFTRQPQWKSVVDPTFLTQVTDQEKQVHELLKLTAAGRSLTLFFLLLAGGVLLFVLIDVVRHRSLERSDEIFVERLFGAQEFAMLLPFAVEAFVLLATALFASLLLLWIVLTILPGFVPALVDGGGIAPLRTEVIKLVATYAPWVVVLQVLLVPLLSMGGAFLGMRKMKLAVE